MTIQRIHIPGAMYHITQRGNLRKQIFFSDEDRSSFCLLMQKYFTKYNHRVHAFCLMDNHVHLLIQAGPTPFAKAMQSIISLHSRRLNRRYKTTGHRFETRFHASVIDTENHLLAVLKYIHMNPVKAHIVRTPTEYLWQTHNHYILSDNIPWVERNFCLQQFDNNIHNAALSYARFMEHDLNDEEISNIQNPANGQIIGRDDFITKILAKTNKLKIINEICTEKLLRITCKHFYYPFESLKRTGKDPLATLIRGVAGYIIAQYSNNSQTELVNLTNRSHSSISRSVKIVAKKIPGDETLQKTIRDILDKI